MINKIFKPLLEQLPENNRAERIWKLAQVDFKKRYYNHALGLFWALLNPLFRVAVYYFIFTKVLEVARDGIDNYALFLFSGIITWQVFVEVSRRSMKILYSKKYLIENVQVAKIDLFISTGLSIFYGFLFNLVAFIIVLIITGGSFGSQLFALPILLISIFMIAIGFGMFLSACYIFIRDIEHIMDVFFLFGFWTSGIFFRGDKFLEIFPPFYYVNPFVGLIINMRAALLNYGDVRYDMVLINFGTACLVYIMGYFLLKKVAHLALERV